MAQSSFDLTNLRAARRIDLAQIFSDPRAEEAWRSAAPSLASLAIPDGNGGVNPGDRRAIFYLAVHLGARSVLEIGTHVGASTTSLAAALLATRARDGRPVELDTVDVRDVNDMVAKPWLEHGVSRSPRDMIGQIGLAAHTRFVAKPAAIYLAQCDRTYDLIFLDGDHAEEAVYLDIAATLKILRPEGVILLHDYFPDERPLWSNGAVGAGPFRAVRRIREQGVAAAGLPMGSLPWPTKCGSSVTSLAVLVQEDS